MSVRNLPKLQKLARCGTLARQGDSSRINEQWLVWLIVAKLRQSVHIVCKPCGEATDLRALELIYVDLWLIVEAGLGYNELHRARVAMSYSGPRAVEQVINGNIRTVVLSIVNNRRLIL